jgi:SPP1 gp7 family putative phage head morphogenesis protein
LLGRAPRLPLPRAAEPTMVQHDYARRLLGIVALARAAYAPLVSELHGLADSAAADRRFDAGEAQRARMLTARAKAAMERALQRGSAEALAREFAHKTATHQRVQLNRQTRAVLGIDAPLTDRHLPILIEGFIHENAARITSIPERLHSDVEQVVTRGLQEGTLGTDLADEVEDRFGVAENRAKLIARDQIGKLTGQIAQARNQEMGVDAYIWRTANDERVRGRPDGLYPKARPSHWALEGKRFTYDNPPPPGHPGQDYQCRCTQEPDFSGIIGDLGDDDDE